ncbi:alpha/beta fold hydrolase [Nocardioides bruguierae]|uniref:alpha/beta fold hydrolase n=1 Tax=Nocardioides bruguierae TaxID=2945102 RepID=UPI002021655E|nr:alpha/beta fold hydrolase [Nocardioides bruguierae]MCL8025910.1 alpha/beta hydrolase [Nocardioides bruguierae]
MQLHGLTSSRARDVVLGMNVSRGLTARPDGAATRVLRYDARAHGRSTGGHDLTRYRWSSLADDLLNLLDHVYPGWQVHGVGPSMGTGTLLHAASRLPDRFGTLTLMVPPTAWETRRAKAEAYEKQARIVEERGIEGLVEAGRVAPVPPAAAHHPDTLPDVSVELLPTLLRGAARADFPSPEQVASIQHPTLILAWTGDPTHPLSTAEKLHDLIPDSRLVVAETPEDIEQWPALFAEHVAAHPIPDAWRAPGTGAHMLAGAQPGPLADRGAPAAPAGGPSADAADLAG